MATAAQHFRWNLTLSILFCLHRPRPNLKHNLLIYTIIFLRYFQIALIFLGVILAVRFALLYSLKYVAYLFDVAVNHALMAAFICIIILSYARSKRDYTTIVKIIENLNQLDEKIQKFKKQRLICCINEDLITKQYNKHDFKLFFCILTTMLVCMLGVDCIQYGYAPLMYYMAYVPGYTLLIHNVTFIAMFQRVFMRKYQLLNSILMTIAKQNSDVKCFDEYMRKNKMAVVFAREMWKNLNEMYCDMVRVYKLIVLCIFLVTYVSMISNAYYMIVSSTVSSLLYEFVGVSTILLVIYTQEMLNAEVILIDILIFYLNCYFIDYIWRT